MWTKLWEYHKAKLIGAAFGIFFGFIYLFFGFWDMMIFAFIVFIGYYMGKKLDQGERLLDLGDLWRWLTDRWKMFR